MIVAARIHALNSDGQVTVLVAYGSINSPKFSFLDIPRTGEDVVITAREDTVELTTIGEQNGTPEDRGRAVMLVSCLIVHWSLIFFNAAYTFLPSLFPLF